MKSHQPTPNYSKTINAIREQELMERYGMEPIENGLGDMNWDIGDGAKQ